MPTTEQIATLRAMVAADVDRHEELTTQLDAMSNGWEGYPILIGAAFFLAVRARLDSRRSPANIIRFVAGVRERVDATGDMYDPRSLELMVRAALGEEGAGSDLSDTTKLRAQAIVVGALGADGSLGDPDEFLREVVPLATRWEQN